MLGMGWFPDTPGGLNRYFRELLEQLPAARAVVIGPGADAPERVELVASASAPLARRLLAFASAARRATVDAELIDAHFALYAALALRRGIARGIPLVFHFHGPWAQESAAGGDRSALRERLRTALERSVLARADAHVVLSQAFRRVLVERYRACPWEVHVWAPGVDLERFSPGERGAARARLGLDAAGERDAFVAVCARRLVPRMGIELLIDAWEQIAQELPAGSQLLIVGDGPLRGALQARAAALAPRTRVRLLGRVPDELLADAYRAADVAVVPTLALEGFGLVVLEAAACGTPSVVSEVGGLAEAAAPLDRSLLVAPGDRDALARRLRAAAQGELPDRARTRRFAERHSWPALAERHRALYRRLIAGRGDGRVRVVYLDHVARLSGGELALARLLAHLEGVNAHVILGEDGPLAGRLAQAGVSVEVMALDPAVRDLRRGALAAARSAPLAALRTLAYVARLTARLRRLRPDLVHANSLKSGVYGSLAARAAGVPLVWHVRDRIAADYLPAPAASAVRALIRRMAAGVIANSQVTLDTLALPRSHPAWVLPSPVDPPAALGPRTTGEVPMFGMVGRIAPWKGQELFLRAFAKAFPQGEERAALVGGALFGEEAYERSLHELAQELGISRRVEFRGFREDVWAELAGFDVLVHASVVPEPFGSVVLEGMAAGAVVVAPDEGGPAAIIREGETGRLFASRDVAALARVMRELRDDAAQRERLAAAARAAVEQYRPEPVAERLVAIYRSLLGSA